MLTPSCYSSQLFLSILTDVMSSEVPVDASVNDDSEYKNDDAKERCKTPGIQRSVAFDLSNSEEKPDSSASNGNVQIRRVTISEAPNSDCDTAHETTDKVDIKSSHKDSTSIKKEIIGILKPPTLKKELKSFPSLPECFLHDLGLLDNFALSAENLSEQDIENKFSSLSLAFKTDRITLHERLELQHRQRDISERNAEDEIRQLKTSVQCLNRLCHQADTRDILRSLEKQVGVLHQSLQRVSSSSEQFGAVQQEGKVATAVEIVLLHVENLKRSYEKEHNELEDARRILIEHKLLVDESHYVRPSNRNRSISVVQPSSYSDMAKPRRASLNTGAGNAQRHLDVTMKNSMENSQRSRSPAAIRKVSQNSCLTTVKEDSDKSMTMDKVLDKVSSVFTPIAETSENGDIVKDVDEDAKHEHDDNNNNGVENKNVVTGSVTSLNARRKESRKTSHFDVDTILEEIDDLALKRDSSPNKMSNPLPKTPTEFMQRKKSLLVQLQSWFGDLAWPYDEEETILCVRYSISALLTTAAFAILLNTFFQ